jgi:hypothetical protein
MAEGGIDNPQATSRSTSEGQHGFFAGIRKRFEHQKQSPKPEIPGLPERAVFMGTENVGGKPKEQLIESLEKSDIYLLDKTKQIFNSPSFTTLPEQKTINLVRMRVSDLAKEGDDYSSMLTKAKELGLEECPPDAVDKVFTYSQDYVRELQNDRKYHGVPHLDHLILGMAPIKNERGEDRLLTYSMGSFGTDPAGQEQDNRNIVLDWETNTTDKLGWKPKLSQDRWLVFSAPNLKLPESNNPPESL